MSEGNQYAGIAEVRWPDIVGTKVPGIGDLYLDIRKRSRTYLR